ncbi:acetyl-coenzyme A synthetase [Staphylococcus aureus DAR3575]|nr:acetyl-coenzyme A synthetase [Staphylococcus aureus DAR3575]
MIEDFKVTIWYTAPTALRMLMSAGDDIVEKYDLSSLRSILSVGEPLNPEVIKWVKKVYGLTVLDTWWMTETGGHMIVNYPTMDVKLGSMGKPLPGIQAAIIDDAGNELPPNRMGNLAIKKGWPSMMYRIWKNPEKYKSYFIGDWYVSGDSAYKDEDGYFWFQGRVDDVIMTAGERVGPFEVESKLVEHEAVAEAGIIGKPDPVRGEIIKAFVALRKGYEPTDELKEEIRLFVKEGLSAHAAPREIEFKDKLPKTRSGKIMRRVLKAWELNLDAGDLSTME